jgi:hypothetical protein
MKGILEKRLFKLWLYTVSHRILLLRSELQYSDVNYEERYTDNRTIDLEFVDVLHLNIDSSMKVIDIVFDRHDLSSDDYTRFTLIHESGESIIVAAKMIVGKSLWTIENKLTSPNLEYDEEWEYSA